MLLRLTIALLTTAAGCELYWLMRPDQLTQADDIVGYPSFHDFNFEPIFRAHDLLVWAMPLGTALVYFVLSRRGPLRVSPRARPVPLLPARAPDDAHNSPEPSPRAIAVTRTARLLPGCAVLLVGASADTDRLGQHISARGGLAAALYLGAVLTAAALLHVLSRGRLGLSLANATGTVVAVSVSVYLFAHSSGTVDAMGRYRAWSWLPAWIAALSAIIGVAAVCLTSLLGRAGTHEVERRVITILGGGSLVYFLTAALTGGVPRIQGFDDMHSVTGADLLTRGYFPWRDVLLMHGLFEDALRSNVGFVVFQHSVWGAAAAAAMIWTPLLWLGYFLLGVWSAPRQWVFHLALVVAATWASHAVLVSVRWVFLPYVLLLVGWSLRRDRRFPTAVMTVALFITSVLVPEESFLVLGVALAVVLFDLTSPGRPSPWWRRLRRTLDFVVAGAASLVVWCGFLLLNHALGPWVDYYLYFAPGHAATGTLPLDLAPNGQWSPAFFVLELVTIVALTWLLVRTLQRRAFTPRYAVMVAATVSTGLYAEKALARFDLGHIFQVFTVAIALWVMMIGLMCTGLAGALDSTRHRRSPHALTAREGSVARRGLSLPGRGAGVRHVGAVVALVIAALVVPYLLGSPSAAQFADAAPGNNHAYVPDQTDAPALIGYQAAAGTDVSMVHDLSRLLDRITPPGQKVYDFTNSPGYFTYLMQEQLPTRFYTVGLALTGIAQDKLLGDLESANPAVVVFDDLDYGLPIWDGPRNEVRNYVISPYLLHGWTPVATSYGFLIMVRNDLLPTLPSLPRLHQPVETRNLYFSMPTCAWGDAPDYLRSTPTGASTTLPVGPFRSRHWLTGSGWAYDVAAQQPVKTVLAASGTTVIAHASPDQTRSDVASLLQIKGAEQSGFAFSQLTAQSGPPRSYAVLADGLAHPIGPVAPHEPTHLRMPGGRVVDTAKDPAAGSVDTLENTSAPTAEIRVPAGLDLSDYGLATFRSGTSALGHTSVTLFDKASPHGLSRDITFTASRPSSSTASVRVGACLQWHGYTSKTLFIRQDGGAPITDVRLSQVAP